MDKNHQVDIPRHDAEILHRDRVVNPIRQLWGGFSFPKPEDAAKAE